MCERSLIKRGHFIRNYNGLLASDKLYYVTIGMFLGSL